MTIESNQYEAPDYSEQLDEYIALLRSSDMSTERRNLCITMFVEMIQAMRALSKADRTIAIFGSAREPRDTPKYKQCVEVAKALGLVGFDILQGDGPGFMEAASLGATLAGRRSFGLQILSPSTWEQRPNPYTTHTIRQTQMHTRNAAFMEADGFVCMDYGIGTLYENTQLLTLLQMGLIRRRKPVVLFGTNEWAPWKALLKDRVEQRRMSESDLELFTVTDDIEKVVRIMLKYSPPKTAVQSAQEN